MPRSRAVERTDPQGPAAGARRQHAAVRPGAALVLLSVVAAQALNLWIIFHSPQGPPDIYQVSEVADALKARVSRPSQNGQRLLLRMTRPNEAPAPGRRTYRAFPQRRGWRFASACDTRTSTWPMVLDPHSPARQTVGLVRRLMSGRGMQHNDNHFIVGAFTVGVRQPDGAVAGGRTRAAWDDERLADADVCCGSPSPPSAWHRWPICSPGAWLRRWRPWPRRPSGSAAIPTPRPFTLKGGSDCRSCPPPSTRCRSACAAMCRTAPP